MKEKLIYIFIILILFSCIIPLMNVSIAAENNEKITLIATVENASDKVTNTFSYKIEPSPENEKTGLTEARLFEVDFNEIAPNSSGKATATYDIDFSDLEFNRLGTYKYIVSEIDSSDKEKYPIDNTKYEIYVQIVRDETTDAKIKIYYNQALNIDTNEKSELEFTHNLASNNENSNSNNGNKNQTNNETNSTSKENYKGESSNNKKNTDRPKTGVFLNILPFTILIVIGVVGIILMKKIKKNDEEDENNK